MRNCLALVPMLFSSACGPSYTLATDTGDTSMPTDVASDSGTFDSTGDSTPTTEAATDSTTPTDSETGGALAFAIDMQKGPAAQYNAPSVPTKISPYIYGINAGKFTASTTKWGFIRRGIDNDTAYNWTIDYYNIGADYCYYQGQAVNGNLAGQYTATTAITSTTGADTIPLAQAAGEAFLATIPILDYVPAKYTRDTGWDTATNASDVCPGTDTICASRSGTSGANVVDKASGDTGFGVVYPFAFGTAGGTTFTGSTAVVANTMTKGSTLCACAVGTATCTGCTVSTNPVAQDEFVNFIKFNYGTAGVPPVFFGLDNKPNYWVSTHPEVYPNTCSTGNVTWDDIATRNINAAMAVKGAWATTKVFGPEVAEEGIVYGGDPSSAHFVAGTTEFADWYLKQLATASASAGTPLIDSFDVFYFTHGTADFLCLEVPRLFWDPNATDISASDTSALDFNVTEPSYYGQYWYPRQVIPRLQKKIAAAYQGESTTPPGLSFGEYDAGCETDVAGGVAEADLLGVFGREGVFAAAAEPTASATNNFLVAAFDLYRNYDGNGAVVGDTAVQAASTDPINTSVYAFASSGTANAVDVVAINKNSTATSVTITIAHAPSIATATIYQLAGTSATVKTLTTAPGLACNAGTCSFVYLMPAISATTITLR